MDMPFIDVDQVVEELLSESSSDEDNILGFSSSSPDSGHGSPLSFGSDTSQSPYNDLLWESTSESLWGTISDDIASCMALGESDNVIDTLQSDMYKQLQALDDEPSMVAERKFMDLPELQNLSEHDNGVVDNITVDVDWHMDSNFLETPVKSEPISPPIQAKETTVEKEVKVEKIEVQQNNTKGAVILNTAVKPGNGQGLTGILLRPVKNGNVTTYITVPVSFTSVKDSQKAEVKKVDIKEPAKPQIIEKIPVAMEEEEEEEEEKKISNFSVSQGNGPNLDLTSEEKRLLEMEGVSLPTDMPLTKAEEKVLKKVRRKIKNKQSAMESRRRRKDYIDNLEKRVKDCTDRNSQLKKQVNNLTDENKSLASQLKELQALIASSFAQTPVKNCAKSAQTGTCLAVLLLSFALFIFPFNPFASSPGKTNLVPGVDPYAGTVVRSRTLLQVDDNTEYDYHDDVNGSNSQDISSLLDNLKLDKLGQADSITGNTHHALNEHSESFHKSLYFEPSAENSQDLILALGGNVNHTDRRTLQ